MTLARANRRTAVTFIETRKPFQASNLTGAPIRSREDSETLGILPEPYRQAYIDAERAVIRGAEGYVVRSYATPIAWVVSGEVTVPPVKYSRSSSVHQGVARFALRGLAEDARFPLKTNV